jgi:hypothetical protein
MPIVTGLFDSREQALQAMHDLDSAGFPPRAVTIIASPNSAGRIARQAAAELPHPPGGFVDLGAELGGQADPLFPETERRTYEERVAQGGVLLRVDVQDQAALERAEAVLRQAGADRIGPGIIRD